MSPEDRKDSKVRHGSSVANIILGEFQAKKLDYEDRSWNLAYLEVGALHLLDSSAFVAILEWEFRF